MGARKFWTNLCDIVVPWQQHNLPQDNKPDISGIPPLFSESLPSFFFAIPPLPLSTSPLSLFVDFFSLLTFLLFPSVSFSLLPLS